ncbi:MAG: pilus assembly protein, partial [Lachnospiraceae bacterium]
MEHNWELTEQDFGVFAPYIQDKNVTDIDYNGNALWITDLKKGRYHAPVEVSEEFVERFTHRIANRV